MKYKKFYKEISDTNPVDIDLEDAWSKECLPLLKSIKTDIGKLRKKLISLKDKRDRAHDNAARAFSLKRTDMYSYWNIVFWHYDEQARLLEDALAETHGIDR